MQNEDASHPRDKSEDLSPRKREGNREIAIRARCEDPRPRGRREEKLPRRGMRRKGGGGGEAGSVRLAGYVGAFKRGKGLRYH